MDNKLYTTKEARLDTLAGDDGRWWEMLQRAELDYRATGLPKVDFQFWLTEHYGLQIYYDYDGILPNHDIVDQKKYFLFNLKYA